MQFHLNGFRTGDPSIAEPADCPDAAASHSLPEQVDVLIVGCGPAGLTLAAQLAAFPDIRTRLIEDKPGPLTLGQADGIACRTIEMFEAFGFSEKVLKEAYWVNETTFWKPDDRQRARITRHGRIQDTEDGLSEFPHVILNQARVHDFYLDAMSKAPCRLTPDYSRRLMELRVASHDTAGVEAQAADYPVTATLQHRPPGGMEQSETVRARFVVGCDGARSSVRKALGLALHGDSANQAWGVMDVLAVTDFPDIRLKATIHSAESGSILIIPREGGYLVRFYIELDKLGENERVSARNISVDALIAAAQRIMRPYTLEVKEVAWWSVYEIGQRLCDRFDNMAGREAGTPPNVFIAGDACHTHSPKAGQGMNVSMQDSFNLGWKLAAVIREQASPEILRTYSDERRAVAQELIDFDRAFAAMFSAPPKDPENPDSEGVDPVEFQRYFVRQGRFTAGTATRYQPSLISAPPVHQRLAEGFGIGMRFHSAPVIRLADAKPVHLGHVNRADGRWRLFIFVDRAHPASPSAALRSICEFLAASPASPIIRFTPPGADVDSVIDVRAVLQQHHREVDLVNLPAFLLPRKGRYGLIDYEKVFCAPLKNEEDIFSLRKIDREEGCVVLVRPDQYIANILPLGAHAEIAAFFERFMLNQRGGDSS